MYFFMKGKEQHLDLRGNLILTHNDTLVKTRTKSAAPFKIVNAEYACVKNGSFFGRIYLTFKIIGFVWGSNEALIEADTNLNKPHVNEPPKDFADRCIYLHENKGYCIHVNNLDNACTGYDNCKDYEVEYKAFAVDAPAHIKNSPAVNTDNIV